MPGHPLPAPADPDAPALDGDELAFLGESLAPLAPDAAVRERILARVFARVTPESTAEAATAAPAGTAAFAPAEPVLTVRADDGDWTEIGPGAHQRVMHDDGRFRTLLVRLAAGASLPPHDHGHAEECFVVEGDIWLSGLQMRRGDYQRVPAGIPHVDIHSDGGCLLHVRAESTPRAYLPG